MINDQNYNNTEIKKKQLSLLGYLECFEVIDKKMYCFFYFKLSPGAFIEKNTQHVEQKTTLQLLVCV